MNKDSVFEAITTFSLVKIKVFLTKLPDCEFFF